MPVNTTMKTQVFNTYVDFLAREDKEVNGVSPAFAAANPGWEFRIPQETPIVLGVDYLQLMTGPGNGTTEVLLEVSKQLKLMASPDDLNLIMVVLAQLGRGC